MKPLLYIFIVLLCIGLVESVNNYISPPIVSSSISSPILQPINATNNNYIIINITNNITNNVTQLLYINFTNNVTNNITNIVVNNISQNITNFVMLNITNNITNNISMTEYLTNNITIYSNCTANFNLTYATTNNITNNVTNNYTSIFNYTYYMTSISFYLLAGGNTSYINFNETKLNETINARINISDIDAEYYGELYNSSSSTLTMTTQNVLYNITGFYSGESNGVILSNNNMRVNKSGLYIISYSVSGSLVVNNDLEFAILINGVKQNKSSVINHYQTTYSVVNMLYMQRLNVNDTVVLSVLNLDSSGRVITFTNRNIIIYKVSN